MTPELKAEVLKALRGDQYPQGKECLMHIDLGGYASYCCLGVITIIAGGKRIDPFKETRYNSGIAVTFGYKDEELANDSFIPMDLADEIGMSYDGYFERTPEIDQWFKDNPLTEEEEVNPFKHHLNLNVDNIRALYQMNDLGYKFPQIADFIERFF